MIRYSTVCITCVTTLKFVQKELVNPIPMATLPRTSIRSANLKNGDCVFACSDHGKPAWSQTVMLQEWSMLNVFRSGRGQWVNQERVCVRCADTVSNHYLMFSNDKSFQFWAWHISFCIILYTGTMTKSHIARLDENAGEYHDEWWPLFTTLLCTDRKVLQKHSRFSLMTWSVV